MKKKKLYVSLIFIAFAVFFSFSFIYLFTLNNIDLKVQAIDGEEVSEIQNAVSEFEGKNLLFLDTDDVLDKLSSFSNYKVVSVEKKYPNKLVVTIKERFESFAIVTDDSAIIIDDEGVVLRTEENYTNNRELVTLTLDGITVSSSNVGQVVSTTDNSMLFIVMAMAKEINYYNCIESIKLEKAVEKQFAYFNTYSGVVIEVPDVHIRGKEKITFAFNEYDSCDSDYIKSFDKITVFIRQDGFIDASWTPRG